MARKTTQKEAQSKIGPVHESRKKQGKNTPRKREDRAPANSAARVPTGADQPVKATKRKGAKNRQDRSTLEKAVAEVEAENISQQLSPAQVRLLAMRKLIGLGEVARILEPIPKKAQARWGPSGTIRGRAYERGGCPRSGCATCLSMT